MTKIQKLRECDTLSDLARLIGYKPQSLGYFIHQFDDDSKYTEFEISKKSGGVRKIHAPIPKLKGIQVRLADLLYDCIDEINSDRGVSDHISHGFRRKRSIFSNAKPHINKRYVFNIDLKDFFPSINFGRVEGFFVKNKNFQLKQPVALAIAQLCCHKSLLPQGAPTSPVISNLIGHILDIRLVNLAKKCGCTYTRYADDITFSSNKKTFPKSIAKQKLCAEDEWVVGKELKRKIESCGFVINTKKTRMQYFFSRQTATGLTVNRKINISSNYYKETRAMCDELFKSGNPYTIDIQQESDGKIKRVKIPVTLASLFGRMDHIFLAKTFEKKPPTFTDYSKPRGFLRVYQMLVFYDFCVQNTVPTIICEGRTDVIYLKSALKKLYKKYPNLIEKDGAKFIFKVRFVHHYKRRARAIGIFDGANNLTSFISKFESLSARIKAPKSPYNTILLTDNDSGVMGKKGLFVNVANKTGKKCNGMDPSYTILPGLHLVPVPKKNVNDEVSIEALFDAKLLNKSVKGKTLNYKTKVNSKTEYDKSYFADKIVKPKYKTIDFTGFEPLLSALNSTII